jgi:hypothetical protein
MGYARWCVYPAPTSPNGRAPAANCETKEAGLEHLVHIDHDAIGVAGHRGEIRAERTDPAVDLPAHLAADDGDNTTPALVTSAILAVMVKTYFVWSVGVIWIRAFLSVIFL